MSTAPQRIPAYVLIIAINGHNLFAPEPDAYRLRDTLVQIGIPEYAIQLLIGAHATRNAIIHHLRNIATNPNILKDAPIIIYFAGHGVQQRFPIPGLGTINAECIIPFDTLSSGNQVLPIPDITISALLGEIAKEKGDQIMLLLDCCHSGSGSRDSDNESRGKLPDGLLNIDGEEFKNEDGDIWASFLRENGSADVGPKSRSIATSSPGSLRYQGIKSHTLIASCREYEESFEYSKSGQAPTGVFTSALIDAFHDCQETGMIWDVTYTGFFFRLKSFMNDDIQGLQRQFGRDKFNQTPQLEGYNLERRVFATPALPHRDHAIAPITATGRPDHYIIPVSSLAGVRPDSEFEVYDYSQGQPRTKGRFRVSAIDEARGSTTIVGSGQNPRLSPDAYAVLCILPPPLYIELSPHLYQIWTSPDFQSDLGKRLNANYPVDRFIALVRPGQASKLRVSPSASTGGIKIEPTDGRSRSIALRDQRASRLSDALAKAVMFYYHLERQVVVPRNDTPFELQAFELIDSVPNDIHYRSILVPDSRRSINFSPNEETRIYHSNAHFGLYLKNRTSYSYYIYIFYFDPNDFSITPIYLPPTDMPSVPKEGELTIGYGNNGAPPLTFTVAPGLTTDPGFFKIFYSTSPSEVGTIKQKGVDPNQRGTPRPGTPYYQPTSPSYGSVLYPIAVFSRPPGSRH
ncbi:Caspase domain [Rhizoctonia solani]|uniref:Caspase domain n=1 Tax=Rhizoctonia solani TaxID=456999 RepID=A0A8H7HE03_9AGAM|nr:Caspase domain [Rhizoctonia solani]